MSRFVPPKSLSRLVHTQALKTPIIAFLLFAMFFPSFFFNVLGTAEKDHFFGWQQDSQSIVERAINERTESGSSEFWGLTGSRQVQIGTQGHLFSILYRIPLFADVGILEGISAALTAIMVTAFVMIVFRSGNTWLAGCIAFVSIASPTLVASARNLYWIPWSWYLPAVLAALLFVVTTRRSRAILHIGIFLAFAFRFGAGYEYMTSVILLAALTPFLAHEQVEIYRKSAVNVSSSLLSSLKIFINGLLAFFAVFFVHAYFRGAGSVSRGGEMIIREDVLRRTYGDPGSFSTVYEASLSASPIHVLGAYLFGWDRALLNLPITDTYSLGLGTSGLAFLISLLLVGLVLSLLAGKRISNSALFLLIGALTVPISWFILAKGHSYIHLHINMVLWYPVTVPVLLYFALGIPAHIIRSHLRAFFKLSSADSNIRR